MNIEEMEDLMNILFQSLEAGNEVALMMLEAKLHREADWVIPGTRHIY